MSKRESLWKSPAFSQAGNGFETTGLPQHSQMFNNEAFGQRAKESLSPPPPSLATSSAFVSSAQKGNETFCAWWDFSFALKSSPSAHSGGETWDTFVSELPLPLSKVSKEQPQGFHSCC